MMQNGEQLTKKYETLFGLQWCLNDNTLKPCFQQTIFTKKKGVNSGPDLNTALPVLGQISRHSLSVVCATVGSHDGVLTAPITLGLRAFLSRACELTSKEEAKQPLEKHDSQLAHIILKCLSEIAPTHNIQPLPRTLIPHMHELKRIVLYHDASTLASAYVMYLCSVGHDGSMCTRIVRANCKLGRRSIPVMECLS